MPTANIGDFELEGPIEVSLRPMTGENIMVYCARLTLKSNYLVFLSDHKFSELPVPANRVESIEHSRHVAASV